MPSAQPACAARFIKPQAAIWTTFIVTYLLSVAGKILALPKSSPANVQWTRRCTHTNPFSRKSFLIPTIASWSKRSNRLVVQGQDAKIRSDISTQVGDRRAHCSKIWEDAWKHQFTKECDDMAQQVAYEKFMEQLARDLKLWRLINPSKVLSGRISLRAMTSHENYKCVYLCRKEQW